MKGITLYTYQNRVTGAYVRNVTCEPSMVDLRVYRLVGFVTI